MMNLLMLIAGALTIFAFSVADRFAGGGYGWDVLKNKYHFPSNPGPYATLLMVALMYGISVAVVPQAVLVLPLIALFWGVYRKLGFNTFGGDLTPHGTSETIGTLIIHLVPAVFVGILFLISTANSWVLGLPLIPFVVCYIIYGTFATKLAIDYAKQDDELKAKGLPEPASVNDKLEKTRGMFFGLMTVIAMGVALFF